MNKYIIGTSNDITKDTITDIKLIESDNCDNAIVQYCKGLDEECEKCTVVVLGRKCEDDFCFTIYSDIIKKIYPDVMPSIIDVILEQSTGEYIISRNHKE